MTVTINGTTGIAGTNGSASTPAFQGEDSNTGIFFPTADTIAFTEGGVERMRIDASGNVGIGTSSPANYTNFCNLEISDAASGVLTLSQAGSPRAQIYYDGNVKFDAFGAGGAGVDTIFSSNGSELLRIGTAGQIGIGGANYGTSGQVLTSGGSGAASSWESVGTATAGLAVGAVGSYGLMSRTGTTLQAAGSTLAGSSLIHASASGQNASSTANGTWRCMGHILVNASFSSANTTTLWLRIS